MDCIFCKIIEGTLPSRKVFENERIIAFYDIQPAAPTHVLIVPKKHIPTVNDVTAEDMALIGEMHAAAQQIARDLGIAETGYRLVINCGKDSGQIVYHIHYHLVGGEHLGAFVGNSDSHA